MGKFNDTELELIDSMSALLKRYNCNIKGLDKGVDKNIRFVSEDGLIDISIDDMLIKLALKNQS